METPTQIVKPRVLIADDNVCLVRALEVVLQMWGFDVTAVYDGSAALAAVREVRPTAALLDISMPRLDGLQVAQQIRADPDLSALMLLAVTGSNDPRDRSSSLAAGFDHHLVKPLNPALLRNLLDRATAAVRTPGVGMLPGPSSGAGRPRPRHEE